MYRNNKSVFISGRSKQIIRYLSFYQNNHQSTNQIKYNTAIREAERVVGYPTSFLSLRWIVNDEVANIANQMRRLLSINHPLLKIAKNLLLGNELPTWGLIVLLVSKLAGFNSNFSEVERDRTADILHSQRILAEVTEMLKTSNIIHKGLLHIESTTTENIADLHFGNKLTLLGGDYLLSTSFYELSRLKNFKVQEIISSAMRDLAAAEFVGLRDERNESVPNKPLLIQNDIKILNEYDIATSSEAKAILGNMKAEWTLKNILGGANLLGKSCQCTLILANHNKSIQELGYMFGKNLALAWQVLLERNIFVNTELNEFNLMLAPIMFHLQYDPGLYREIEKAFSNIDTVDYDLIRKNVMSGPALEKMSEFQKELSHSALDILYKFSDSDSRTALVNIIKSMC